MTVDRAVANRLHLPGSEIGAPLPINITLFPHLRLEKSNKVHGWGTGRKGVYHRSSDNSCTNRNDNDVDQLGGSLFISDRPSFWTSRVASDHAPMVSDKLPRT